MCNNNNTNNNSCECLSNILEVIICLQRKEEQATDLDGCDKPYLGPCPSFACFNTRPVTFYNCCSGTEWTFPYTLNGATGSSNVFRVENVEGCCCTCRVLAPNPDTAANLTSPYVATDSFFTINLKCVGALKCLPDVYVPCV